MTETLLFANSPEEKIEVDGINIFNYVVQTYKLIGSVIGSPLNILLFSFIYDYMLHPRLWYCKYREWKTNRAVGQFYQQRMKNKAKRDTNLLDIIIEDNKKLPLDKKWSEYDIAGTVSLF